MGTRLDQDEFVLAVMSAAAGGALTPVQVQKLFFLLDARAAGDLGGPYFRFEPYDYGPFDASVYGCLERLAARGAVRVDRSGSVRSYGLTQEGQAAGQVAFERLNPRVREFAHKCAQFVRSVSFPELVSAIYREFPEMKAKSVFREPA